MCLVPNEGRAPARTTAAAAAAAGRPWSGSGGGGRGAGRGAARAARGPGRRPAAERAQPGRRLWAFQCLLSPPHQGRKEDGRREGRKRGRRGLSRWKAQAAASSLCGCSGRTAPPAAARLAPGRVETGGGLFACVLVCASGRGPGRDMCVWAVHCGELGLRLYVCSLKWVERWPVPGMFHDVVQPQEGG